jgi:hypothetical protein
MCRKCLELPNKGWNVDGLANLVFPANVHHLLLEFADVQGARLLWHHNGHHWGPGGHLDNLWITKVIMIFTIIISGPD